ncbi:hypothetical protein GCM10011360_02050 [Primorskyibacter flagellatus]|uniref:Uncharacterized protein n=1 Tax=Primorskyibacter flagellatus TaxID=1387277 RepID=A0A917EAQ1_9RHOB|nr:hypothetical protein [Primorskyibacter flagellatus]GGE16865.1 hypothetical protein GCM10011360_02050 [Primorskyibacter flagellatus]
MAKMPRGWNRAFFFGLVDALEPQLFAAGYRAHPAYGPPIWEATMQAYRAEWLHGDVSDQMQQIGLSLHAGFVRVQKLVWPSCVARFEDLPTDPFAFTDQFQRVERRDYHIRDYPTWWRWRSTSLRVPRPGRDDPADVARIMAGRITPLLPHLFDAMPGKVPHRVIRVMVYPPVVLEPGAGSRGTADGAISTGAETG